MDRLFIRKAHEDKVVSESQMLSTAVTNAIGNAWRKKNKDPQPLWKKKQKKLDKDVAEDTLENVLAVEEKEGKGWLDILYSKNGMRRPKRDRTVDKVNRINQNKHEDQKSTPDGQFHSVYKQTHAEDKKDVKRPNNDDKG